MLQEDVYQQAVDKINNVLKSQLDEDRVQALQDMGTRMSSTASTKATPSPSSPFSTTMVNDMFSRTDDIKCFSCNELVNFGDDYEAHLQVVHRVTKNFSFYMSKALEQKKFQE